MMERACRGWMGIFDEFEIALSGVLPGGQNRHLKNAKGFGMNFLALACDYDGTLAKDGAVSESTLDALKELQQSGRKLVLVTGRELDQLMSVFPRHEIFDWIVAENGALLYCPRTRESRLLCEGVPAAFPEALRERGVPRVSVGGAIVATWRP